MGLENKIKERVSDAVAKSYYKPWHKRVSGRIFLTIMALIMILSIYFAIKVSIAYYHTKKGEIYNAELGIWLTQDQYIDNQKIAADIMTDDDPWLGAENPIINVIVYESFACPFCQADQETLKRVMEKFGMVLRLTIRDYPTEGIHPGVFEAHLAASCANEQEAYWVYRDILFENQGSFDKKNLKLLSKNLGINIAQFDKCLDEEKYASEIRQDYSEGVDLDIPGTPTYIINGAILGGSRSYENWEEIIGYILKGEV
ncbi:MAG: thioredoxin domain-containing protein [Patescibacteria group bacterium]|jgi:protein-disulfide isomerase